MRRGQMEGVKDILTDLPKLPLLSVDQRVAASYSPLQRVRPLMTKY